MYYYITAMSRKKFAPLLYLLSTNPGLLVPSKSSLFASCHPLLKGYACESYLFEDYFERLYRRVNFRNHDFSLLYCSS
jgi:hypothetical protein